MCLLCGEIADGARSVSVSHRPLQLLGGLWWRGSFAEAGEGAIRAVLVRARAFSAGRRSAWKSPIVGLSRNGRSDGFDYFVGIAVEEGETLPADFEHLEVPQMTVASCWHGPDDGDVPARYGKMLEWLRDRGFDRDVSFCHHREEYPHDVDLDGPPALRLCLPVAGEDAASSSEVPF